ncbi:hypothetical protein ACFQ68_18725 [Amycolatopsis japonica]|uniref:hypothetical protein n=1 Tax=Amycolatopsis japonica TaxID=208439 RepID=UPI00366B95DA
MATALLAGAADDAFDRACRLLMDELSAIPLTYTADGALSKPQLNTSFKAALIAQVHRSVHIRSLTEAFRVVDAAYSDLTVYGQCTEAAVHAACGALYGSLDPYRPAMQTMLRDKARSMLNNALAVVIQTGTVRP